MGFGIEYLKKYNYKKYNLLIIKVLNRKLNIIH